MDDNGWYDGPIEFIYMCDEQLACGWLEQQKTGHSCHFDAYIDLSIG